MSVEINIADKNWDKINFDFNKISDFVLSYMKYKGKNKTISILLTNNSEIKKINKQYRDKNKPTNILSFEIGESGVLGDIALSYETIKKESEDQNISFENHLTHLIVHGVLHLLGYDHIKDSEAKEMEDLEIKILDKMGIENPYKKIDSKKWYQNKLCYYLSLIFVGVMTATGFAPLYFTPISLVGLGLLYWLTYKTSGFKNGIKSGFFFGFGYSMFMLSWMVSSFFVDSESAKIFGWLAPIALIFIGIVGGFVFGLPIALTSMMKDNSWRRPIYFSAFWAIVLWFRYWAFTGFPWNPIDLILIPYPILINCVSVIGNLGLSFILVGFVASITHLIVNKTLKTPVLLVSLAYLLVFFIMCLLIKTPENTDSNINVRIVQSGIEQKFKWDKNLALENLKKHIDLSNLPIDKKLDFIIWPESSYPFVFSGDKFPFANTIKTNFDKLIFGAVSKENGDYYNSIITTDKNGNVIYKYNKHHLVPFGEYNPFIALGLPPIVPVPGNLKSGHGPVSIEMLKDYKVSFASCYEIIFSEGNIPTGEKSDVIINLTNDGWFGRTFGPYQHLDIAKSMAIESGVPIIRSAYSGITTLIYPDGHTTKQLGLGESGVLDLKVPLAQKTIFSKIGNNKIIIFIISLICFCFISRKLFRKD